MVDVKSQYDKISEDVKSSIVEVIESSKFINGPSVKSFAKNLEEYLDVRKVIPCANGTDALQIALMGLGLKPGDGVIVPAFTYVATAEVIALLGLTPVMVDVDYNTFNINSSVFEEALTDRVRAIVPVHLYGQCADMEPIMELAKRHNVFVVEDNAQAIGADYTFSNGMTKKSGTIAHVGTTSFYPSKNLGAFGDGGALYTNDESLGEKLRMIANHGQSVKYVHDIIGCNSRLDSIQAAILDVKLKFLDDYAEARQQVANYYDIALGEIEQIEIPHRHKNSTHVFHQYTIKVKDGRRDELKRYLQEKGIPTMIYYPIPLYKQKAFSPYAGKTNFLPITEKLCQEVISLPIHTEMDEDQLNYIIETIGLFFK